jgi:phosphoribosylamine--glycine ligase
LQQPTTPYLTCLVIGAGGREHALAWALARSPEVAHVYVAPGNAGTAWPANPDASGWQPRAAAENVAIPVGDIDALKQFALDHEVGLTVVGPEVPLAAGIVDAFIAAGLPVFGPVKAAAQLEASKAFAKQFMVANNIPTAAYAMHQNFETALEYVRMLNRPLVVKADGLAAGKGVIVCADRLEAEAALKQIMSDRDFGTAGDKVVIEERLQGREISALAFCDGSTYALMPLTRDHKRVFDNDEGPNTGGMGAYGPLPDGDAALREAIGRDFIQPALDALAAQGTPYVGVLYAGLMQTPDGLRLLEYNCRFGDPETQVILPLLESSLAAILRACVEGRLTDAAPQWREGVCMTVGLASGGYPGNYPTGLPISGLDATAPDVVVFHAGTAQRDGQTVTAGGRVLSVSAWGEDLPAAAARAYDHIEAIAFSGMHYRRDIGGGRSA